MNLASATKIYLLAIMTISVNVIALAQNQSGPGNLLQQIFAGHPAYFDTIMAQRDTLKVQVIYSQIDRKKKGKPVFTDHSYHVDPNNYYYPASTVKLPVAILALQKLKRGVRDFLLNDDFLLVLGNDAGTFRKFYVTNQPRQR